MRKSLIQHTLENECRLDSGQPVVVGVSGGPDSVCLLDVLNQAGYPVFIAHYNHQLRPDSDADEEFVRLLAAARDLPFLVDRGEVAVHADETGQSIEAAGRELRYRFLFGQAAAHRAQAVAVGHTADDQVETVLMHFIRGAGLRGLRGMPYRRRVPQFHAEIPLVRPLLSLWRKDVIRYCEEEKLQSLEDLTNKELTFLRNRVRHELFPILERYNPKIKEVILRMTGVMGGELEVVEASLDRHWDEILVEVDKFSLGFERSAWNQLPNGTRRGLFLRALRSLLSDWTKIDFETIRRALLFLSKPDHNGQITLHDGLQIVRRPDRLWVLAGGIPVPGEAWPKVLAETTSMTLEVPGELVLQHGWRITAEKLLDLPKSWPAMGEDPDEFQAWIDGTQFPGPFSIRSRLPGDRFRPLGLAGQSQKVSDLMINVKLPAEARLSWPLIEFGGEILWVPGIRLSHIARLSTGPHEVIRLQLRPPPP